MASRVDTQRLIKTLENSNTPYVQHTEWHYTLMDRFDYWPTKDKWADRTGVYGMNYGLSSLLDIIADGALGPGEGVILDQKDQEPPRRALADIIQDMDDLWEELKEGIYEYADR